MQHPSEPTWRDREVVQLQDEVALLIHVLAALTPIGTGSHDRQGRQKGPPRASRPTPRAQRATGGAHGPGLPL